MHLKRCQLKVPTLKKFIDVKVSNFHLSESDHLATVCANLTIFKVLLTLIVKKITSLKNYLFLHEAYFRKESQNILNRKSRLFEGILMAEILVEMKTVKTLIIFVKYN